MPKYNLYFVSNLPLKSLLQYHLPFQSGSNKILKDMHRVYTREHYLDIFDNVGIYHQTV